jgi:hypothetical protein
MNIQSTTPATPLRRRMIQDMRGRDLGRHSQRNHVDSCARFRAMSNLSRIALENNKKPGRSRIGRNILYWQLAEGTGLTSSVL